MRHEVIVFCLAIGFLCWCEDWRRGSLIRSALVGFAFGGVLGLLENIFGFYL